MTPQPHVDEITGAETTGHEWDGIRELNNPLPKWWLWVLYATIAWAAVYAVLFPSVPGLFGHTDGVLGYSSRVELAQQMQVAEESRSGARQMLSGLPYQAILRDPDLRRIARAGGEAAFADNCAACHGVGGAGRPGGFPVLADDAWIWGGRLQDIETTILHGVRWEDDVDTRLGDMPAYGDGYFEPEVLDGLVEYVVAISGGDADRAMARRGETAFLEECATCHAESGRGIAELGAPSLADAIWLYGGKREHILAQIVAPRHGVMPAWQGRLDPITIRMLTVYVHTLGGGQ